MQRWCDCQLTDSTGATPIGLAVKAKSNILVGMMLRDTVSLDYHTLLIVATEYNNDWVTEKAHNPVSPNITHRGTVPPLLPTKPAFVQFLLADPRTDLDQCNQFGKTAPIYAVCNNWVSVMRDIVAKKMGSTSTTSTTILKLPLPTPIA